MTNDIFGLNKILGSILIDPQIAKRKKEDARRNSNDRYHAKKLAKELNMFINGVIVAAMT